MIGENSVSNIPLPEHKIDKNIIKVSIITEVIETSIILLVLGGLFYLDYLFNWKVWIGWILIGLTVITVIAFIWSTLIRPVLLYRNTRYEVDEQYMQLKTGALFEKHQLIPMTKIQSVETNQGPIMRKYGLYSLSVETMASSHSIVGLSESRAIKMRNQIAHYAKIREVE